VCAVDRVLNAADVLPYITQLAEETVPLQDVGVVNVHAVP
jgi:hypothetical protein